MATPRIRYARTTDGVNIAWAEVGSGPPTVLRVGNGATIELLPEVLPAARAAATVPPAIYQPVA
jgi:hypothetical protein